jgi:hypothetical protein
MYPGGGGYIVRCNAAYATGWPSGNALDMNRKVLGSNLCAHELFQFRFLVGFLFRSIQEIARLEPRTGQGRFVPNPSESFIITLLAVRSYSAMLKGYSRNRLFLVAVLNATRGSTYRTRDEWGLHISDVCN